MRCQKATSVVSCHDQSRLRAALGQRELISSPGRRQRELPVPIAQPALDDVEDALNTA